MLIVTTGFFDGVHLGHKKVLERVSLLASERGCKSAVVTFWPHPRSVLQQDAYKLRLLTTLDEKKKLFRKYSIDKVSLVKFTKRVSNLSTFEFVNQYLIKKLGATTLVIGYDHRIGKNVGQSQDEMIRICQDSGLEVVRVGEFFIDEQVVSSTKIRTALEGGDIKKANRFLGYNYTLEGVVVVGNRLGRTIGFPTANLKLYSPLKMLPQNGVYFVNLTVAHGRKVYKGICNIGCRPTISPNGEKTIETHILDFDEDIYGLDLRIEFIDRIREEKKFESLDELKKQLERDRDYSSTHF